MSRHVVCHVIRYVVCHVSRHVAYPTTCPAACDLVFPPSQVLDISDDPNERHLFSVSFDSSVRRILRRPEVWPNLVSLDVSGRPLETAENDKFKSELYVSVAHSEIRMYQSKI